MASIDSFTMQQSKPLSDIDDLFDNSDPSDVWHKSAHLIRQISPTFDSAFSRQLFDDVMHLFQGEYPGYHPIRTPYHDQRHTLDVFSCAVRLMHGMHVSGDGLDDNEIELVLAASLTHDVGYAQKHSSKATGTGAQFTKDHIQRGIDFLQSYLGHHSHPAGLTTTILAPIVQCSDPMLPLASIDFPSDRIRRLGQILGTADLVGQMADRKYLEKLTSLYAEFQEAGIGNYHSIYDLMCKTHSFYAIIKKKLDDDFGGLYARLTPHFEHTLHENKNLYMDSIENNMSYLKHVVALGEDEFLTMLRRGRNTNNLFRQ